MKFILFAVLILLALFHPVYGQDTEETQTNVQPVPGGVGIAPMAHLSSPVTVWAGGHEYYFKFNDDRPPGKYTGFINCIDKAKKETQELKMDDGRVFLYCKPIIK